LCHTSGDLLDVADGFHDSESLFGSDDPHIELRKECVNSC